ncbi:MAG: acyl-CoA dehydrogenase family protein [Candidatus Promineofilum sp.]|nr:acyl-CoA dehydrogenase family protein [Promineifilum sp.]MCW5865016.1 acyl-CoA dehydrogenase family protein [Anaerolineae bacterium]
MFPFITDEHRMIEQAARDFGRNSIAPIAAEHDETGDFPLGTIREMGQLGFMGIEVPEEYGGAGMDTLAYVLAMVEISKADASHGTIMSVNNSLYAHGLLKFGTEEQKQKYLVPVATGQKIGAYSLTEPMSGSDAGTMKSRAVLNPEGTCYVINGRKSWVTSAPYADFIILFTMTQPEKKHKGVTAFIIDTDRPGFARGKKEPKLGIRASATSEILFDNYECPVENRLGAEGEGFKIAMTVLDAGRIGIASQALGIAEAALEASIAYAQEREAFGQKIGEFQQIQAKLADMKCRVDASRLLIYQAALAKMASKGGSGRYSLEASEAKLFASETAMWVTTQAIQIHGGMGYSKEMPLERYFRDAKITEIYEGTSEIQRMVIARALTGLR